jgi:hypothetical protein
MSRFSLPLLWGGGVSRECNVYVWTISPTVIYQSGILCQPTCISFVSSSTLPWTVTPLQWKYTGKGKSLHSELQNYANEDGASVFNTNLSEFHLQRVTFKYLWTPPHFLSVTDSWIRYIIYFLDVWILVPSIWDLQKVYSTQQVCLVTVTPMKILGNVRPAFKPWILTFFCVLVKEYEKEGTKWQ